MLSARFQRHNDFPRRHAPILITAMAKKQCALSLAFEMVEEENLEKRWCLLDYTKNNFLIHV
jgi:hypothetical protein